MANRPVSNPIRSRVISAIIMYGAYTALLVAVVVIFFIWRIFRKLFKGGSKQAGASARALGPI